MNANNKKIKELVVYFVVGASTTLVNILCYHFFVFLNIDYKIANLIALFLCKVYGYFANKNIVFNSKCDSIKELFGEIIRYITSRGFTGVVDFIGLIFLVDFLKFDKIYSKYAMQVLIIILNYVLGKFFVFNNTSRSEDDVL